MVYMIETNEKEKVMITVETTTENEYLDTLEELCVEKVERVKRIESLENRIAHERYMIKTNEKEKIMITVETTLENEYLDTLAELCDEKVKRVQKIESLENRIAHERYMIKTLEEKMSTNSENYRKDIVNTVAAALAQ